MTKAKNNIRRLSESGHITIPDPDRPGHLKIIDSLGPQVKKKHKGPPSVNA
tara:strand:+ start:569 stop:721 length:153 start_codon:yes stop_codon:yes gene_type:complete